jgi:DNA-nicking Smr family endonuclease
MSRRSSHTSGGTRRPRRTVDVAAEPSELFRSTVGDVRPVPTRRVPLAAPPPPARANFRRQDDQAVLVESLHGPAPETVLEAGEALAYRRPGVSLQVLRDLKRGRYRAQDELDLHGLTAREAQAALREFMAEILARDLRCVRMIHGKGRRSGPAGPVLKTKLNRWLPQWDRVVAFASAPARDGGTGALYVLLRR